MSRFRRLFLLVGLALFALWLWLPRSGPHIDPGSVLTLDVSGTYVESAETPLFARLLAVPERPLAGLLGEFAKAERDDRLGAVVVRIRNLGVGWAKAQEIRDAIASLAEKRHTVAYLEIATLASNLEYYVASAADEVFLAPGTRAPVLGLAAEYLYLGGLWDLLGVEVEVERVGRYKTAADTYAGRGMSEAGREMANSLLDSIDAQFVRGIAEARKLPEEAVRRTIDDAPVDPDAMRHAGLIDGVLYHDELVKKLGGPSVSAETYAQVLTSEVGFEPKARFALVYGTGAVITGRGDISPAGSPVMASDTVSAALDDAVRDDSIDAVIFRIDSPGGSPLASDIVWRATERAKSRGKPLVASFSDVAASGGYYAAAGADSIVASPASITGSIGVFVLRPVMAGLLAKLEIGSEELTRGARADLQLSTRPLSEESRLVLRRQVESTYALFVERVSAGRLDADRVDALGRGRVWTGAQAHEVGLVDVLGGLRAAVAEGRRLAGLAPDVDVELVPFPPPRPLLVQLNELMQSSARSLVPRWAEVAPAADLLRRVEPWLRAARDEGPTALLPFSVEIR